MEMGELVAEAALLVPKILTGVLAAGIPLKQK